MIKEILRDIFGFKSADCEEIGLVDAANETVFRQKLETVKSKWDQLELNNRLVKKDEQVVPSFHQWFVDEKADTMVKCMLADVRTKAGMGCNPDHFYTNTCESMNSTLKRRTEFKSQDVRPFVEKMLELTEAQETLTKKAVIRNDRWRFRDEYKHLEVDHDKWFSMTVSAQQRHFSSVYNESLNQSCSR